MRRPTGTIALSTFASGALMLLNVSTSEPFAIIHAGGVVGFRGPGGAVRPRFLRSQQTPTRMMAKPSTPMPRNIKETVSFMRAAVQEGLRAQQSRMDVDLPFAARLGVEVDPSEEKGPSADDIQKSDRELARLFVDMFDVIGDHVVVAFPTDAEASAAKKAWAKGAPYRGKVVSMKPQKKKGPKIKRGTGAVIGFAAAVKKGREGGGVGGQDEAAGGIVSPGTEVLLVVAPKQAELSIVERLSRELGAGCLIVLLNSRLHQASFMGDEQRDFFLQEFQSVFHLRPLGTETNDFVFRAYPKDWTVARKPKIGPPKVLLSKTDRPNLEEIRAAVKEGDEAAGIFGNIF
ncbi:unnamed protein product [Discosporangium mesarthrocarpum]